MSDIVIKVEDLSKQYRLGLVGTGTLSHDLNRWWHQVRGKEDPYLKIGETNDRSTKGSSEYVWALKDLNFEVKQGEVLGIIGKNGAGKSTLLKLLSRVTSPTTGSIKAKGRIASLLEVGTGFHPELTGRDNIYLNGAILGMTKAEIRTRFDEIVAFSGTERYIDTPVKRYSSGMRVRLAFAVAAFLEPEILIVDEVLAVGDAEFQKKAIGKMQDVAKGGGRTVLFVSHNMDAVKSLCNTAIFLEYGKIIREGGAEEIVDKYLSEENTKSMIELSNRVDRSGNGQIRINKLVLKNSNTNQPLTEVISGMPITFEIFFEASKRVFDINKIEIGLAIFDSKHRFVTVLNNAMANYSFNINTLEGIAYCKVNKFPLMGGVYFIRTMIKLNDEIGDLVESAIKFVVHEGDFYSSGKNNAYGRQGVYIEQEWKL
jgi:lipopolysaccharide transport system ATP-binding protein